MPCPCTVNQYLWQCALELREKGFVHAGGGREGVEFGEGFIEGNRRRDDGHACGF